MDARCRLCAELYHNQIRILEDSRFSSLLTQLFQLEITPEDKLPLTACHKCYQLVEQTWQFKEQVNQSQILLADLASTAEVLTEEIKHNAAPEAPLFGEEYKTDVKCFHVREHHLTQDDVNPLQDPHERHNNIEQVVQVPPTKKANRVAKRTKRNVVGTKKGKSLQLEGLKDIEYVNPDGSVVPKSNISGWETYQWSCLDCNNIFQASDELREHFANVHNCPVRYPCMDCPKVYSVYATFVNHVKDHRPQLKFCCDICCTWYGTETEIEVHRRKHYEERPYRCNTCGKRFRMQSVLLVHTRSHLPDDVKNSYHCDECPKKFGTKPNLMAHKRIHLGVRDYTCDQCGKSFIQKGNLDNHLLTHNVARPFSCGICSKSFKTLIRLRKHGAVHSGLKPHQCDICGRQFRERGTLKDHHRIHTGVLPFTCEYCGKSFRFKGVLTTHLRQHTGERPYSCNECQHHFANWPNYNKHMKRRHGINTSVNCRTRQDIPPTGRPHRNPPGTVLAPPQPPPPPPPRLAVTQTPPVAMQAFAEAPAPAFYPVLGLYGIPEDLLQQRV